MKKYKDTIANQKQNKLHLEDRKFLQSIKEATHGRAGFLYDKRRKEKRQ